LSGKRITALRGAVQALNEEEDIVARTTALYDSLLGENGLTERDLVSLVFSVTGDLDANNPAGALRQAGRAGELAMMVFQEAAYEGSLPRIIRVLLHCYMDSGQKPRHVYINGAEVLRPDRTGFNKTAMV
jgi:chorismate mutase